MSSLSREVIVAEPSVGTISLDESSLRLLEVDWISMIRSFMPLPEAANESRPFFSIDSELIIEISILAFVM